MTGNPPSIAVHVEHIPHLPLPGSLTATDRVCSAALPSKNALRGTRRVFHEAGPVAFVGNVEPVIRCIHCAREFAP